MTFLEKIKNYNSKMLESIKNFNDQQSKDTQDQIKKNIEEDDFDFAFDAYKNFNTANYDEVPVSKALYDKKAYEIMEEHAKKSSRKCKIGTKKVESLSNITTKTTYNTEFGAIIHTSTTEGGKCFSIEKNHYTGYVDYFYEDNPDADGPLKIFADIECKNLSGSFDNFEGFVIDQNGSVIKVNQSKNHEDTNFPNLHKDFLLAIKDFESTYNLNDDYSLEK